ncbi:MAG: class I SAM-dependent methyltransferase [bacterium]|nr:class I SAM-dependent methyltransferase [bacterium]
MVEAWYELAFGATYPAVYGHRDREEAERCLDLLSALDALAEPILDMGCGDGRHLALLADAGRRAVGLDLSVELLGRARTGDHGPVLDLVRGDMRNLPLADGSCGAVLSLFTAFGYFGDEVANAQPVAEAARVLRPGGTWCLDYLDADRLRRELDDGRERTRQREAGPLTVTEVRRLDPVRGAVLKEVRLQALAGSEDAAASLGCGREGLSYREEVALFTLDQLDAMAGAAGLTRKAAAGGYGGQALGAGNRWILVYAKPERAGGSP